MLLEGIASARTLIGLGRHGEAMGLIASLGFVLGDEQWRVTLTCLALARGDVETALGHLALIRKEYVGRTPPDLRVVEGDGKRRRGRPRKAPRLLLISGARRAHQRGAP